ncbi:hypothetical protein EIN_077390 [Entamoeba invadens IP1]|uniref:Uncharacterized protein n=1 Tax=Entamoeba invadens IP1 TaxID=370355 RepID=A0A0A1TWA5_ENTIV|nr:hypothetical protein EIN_077390 [Entamoeba invadens IP1]ELP83584.1 hypothetical protein EIN_077390 [Entamoeba invadens IP1]|eukprot:XP_004182930.1 hypothetical protein EIN_077390 [Entamoeba invadens IP1]
MYTKHLELQQQWIPSSVLAESDKGYGIGDSRVNYGDEKFHIYTHVHSDPTEDSKQGHEGDALFIVTDNGEVEKVWPWGCSHMMSGLQGWNNNTKTMIHDLVFLQRIQTSIIFINMRPIEVDVQPGKLVV